MHSINWEKVLKVGTLIGQLLTLIFIVSAIVIFSSCWIPPPYLICAIGIEISLALIVVLYLIRLKIADLATNSSPQTPEPPSKGLSKFEFWSLIFSLLTVVISALGFWYVIKGLKASDNTYLTSTYLQTYGWTYDIDKTFIEHPELKPYFYNNVPIIERSKQHQDSNYNRAFAAAQLIIDNMDAILNNQNYFDAHRIAQSAWDSYAEDLFNHSPILDSIFKQHPCYWPHLKVALDKSNCLKFSYDRSKCK